MLNPIPPGTRDVLPDEMRELLALERTLAELYDERGYGPVATPTIEYDEVLAQAESRSSGAAYRFFDEQGDLLALRTEMTVPIARMVATRFPNDEPPFRFSYSGRAYRTISPQRGQMREFIQSGVELIGAAAPDGTAEIVGVLDAALEATGLGRAVIGLGDADLYRQLLVGFGVEEAARDRILDRLAMHDLVGLESEVEMADGLGEGQREALLALPALRGGPEVLERAIEIGGEPVKAATSRLAATYESLVEGGVAGRVQLDLGLLRDLGYYTGAIVEVYDPAVGHILGGGGRYDGLLAHFGRDLPAAGFAIFLERVHLAQTEEDRIAREHPDPASQSGGRLSRREEP